MDSQRWSLSGHLALVTGGSRGIGRACARELLGLGADVVLAGRDEDLLDQVLAELAEDFPGRRIEAFSADVSEADGREGLAEGLRDSGLVPHLLINNVGNNIRRAALELTADEWHFIWDTNVRSAFELSRLLHPALKSHGRSAIVNIASVSGMTHVRTGVAYGMSKAAVVQMTRNLACEWASDGIRVNAVSPWYIRTDRTSPALSDPDYLDEVLARTPLGRIGEPEEVAAAVAFLCLPAAAWITGQCLAVDGGFLAHGF